MKKVVFCIVAVIVFVFTFILIRYFSVNPYQLRLSSTCVSLVHLRGSLKHYKEEVGEFPESLTEMEQHYDGHDSYSFKLNKEYISSYEEGSNQEFNTLNGKGGWYYNKETGEIVINIDKPLKSCFDHYYYSNRNEVPADW